MMTKEKISNYFIELLNVLETKIDPKNPNFIYYVYKDKIYMRYNKKDNYMWMDYDKIWSIFESNYSHNHEENRKLTASLVEKHLKLKGVRTSYSKVLFYPSKLKRINKLK